MSSSNHSRTDSPAYSDYSQAPYVNGSGFYIARCFNCDDRLQDHEGHYCDLCVAEQAERNGEA